MLKRQSNAKSMKKWVRLIISHNELECFTVHLTETKAGAELMIIYYQHYYVTESKYKKNLLYI